MFFNWRRFLNGKAPTPPRARPGYRPEVLPLEDRVVPSVSMPHPLGIVNAPSPPAFSDSAPAPAGDHGIGEQVTAKVQELQGASPHQGIGPDLSAFIQTILPNQAEETGPAAAENGDQGIGAQVSAKAHELQAARPDDGLQGIGHELSAFVHTLRPDHEDVFGRP